MGEGGMDQVVPGTALPRVPLPATDGTAICVASLSGRSVIAVYPWTGRPGQPNPPRWDDIPGAHGSTPEIEGFRDQYARFRTHETRVFGLSRQDTDYQQELARRLGLPFPILSDADGVFSNALNLPGFATGAQTYLKRLTLAVNNGHIERIFFPVSDPAGHAGEVLHWLETMA